MSLFKKYLQENYKEYTQHQTHNITTIQPFRVSHYRIEDSRLKDYNCSGIQKNRGAIIL